MEKNSVKKSVPKNEGQLVTFLFVLIAGVTLRLCLINMSSFVDWLQNRIEIITPLNSWQRVLEGIYLKNRLTPVDSDSDSATTSASYQGDLVHELPMMLRLYEWSLRVFDTATIKFMFVLADGLNAVLIYAIAIRFIQLLIELEKTNLKAGVYTRFLISSARSEPESKAAENFLLTPQSFPAHYWSIIVLAIYLFNPFTCASCVAMSTTTLQNTILLLWLYFLLDVGRRAYSPLLSIFFLAWHTQCSIYSFNLLPATVNFLHQHMSYLSSKPAIRLINTALKYVSLFVAISVALVAVNFYLENFDSRFVSCTYLFVFRVPDLLPNMGLFWYFFTEMFDHFVAFFTYVFQLNAFVYTLPLAVRLHNAPLVNLVLQMAIVAVFKSYPSMAETGLYLSLMPCIVAYLFPLMRNFLVYACMFLVATVLAPVMFYLWVGSGGGNANFFFAITLVYSIAQIFLIIDVLYAHLKREFIKLNGIDQPKDKTGQLAKFSLD